MSTCTHANYMQIWNCHELWMQTEGNQKKRDIEPNVGYNCVPGTPAYPFCFKADRLLSTYKCLCKIQLQISLSYLVKTRVPHIQHNMHQLAPRSTFKCSPSQRIKYASKATKSLTSKPPRPPKNGAKSPLNLLTNAGPKERFGLIEQPST